VTPETFPALWALYGPALLTETHRHWPHTPAQDVEAVCRDLYLRGCRNAADIAEAIGWLSRGTVGRVPRISAN
jgi:hypothetical protein